MLARVLLLLTLSLLSACALFRSKEEKAATDLAKAKAADIPSAEVLYKRANDSLKGGIYNDAIEKYEQLESLYPFGRHAAQGLLDLAFAYFKFDEPDQAIATAERFIQLYPSSPFVDYAHYIKGIAQYNRDIGFVDRYLPVDATQRDPGSARESLRDFEELLRKYPNSRYAADARQRLVYLRNRLALYELHGARFYMKRGAYVAAAERCNGILRDYQRTVAVPPALKILEEAYLKMGMTDLARDTAAVYAHNYPGGAPDYERLSLKERTSLEKIWQFLGLDRN